MAKELADQIVEELDRIHDFSETALGQLAGCVGACAACPEYSHGCKIAGMLRRLYAKTTHYWVDGLSTRDVL